MHDEPTCGPDVRPVDEDAQRRNDVLRDLLNAGLAVFARSAKFALILDQG